MNRMAASLAMPGIDPRSWVEYGTVASVGGDDGVPNFSDPNAVVIDQNGVEVDVVIGTDEHPLTCRWGITAGDCFIIPPIFPGDHVMVLIPGGDLGNVGEIVKILPGPHTPLPLDDSDRKPLFRNDRMLVFASTVPIDLRTKGGARLLLNQDGTVQVGRGDAAEQAVLGTTQRSAEAEMNASGLPDPTSPSPSPVAGLQGIWFNAAQACVGPLAPLKAFFLEACNAVGTYEGKAPGFLSEVVKLK